MRYGVAKALAGFGGRLAAFALMIAAVAAGLGQLPIRPRVGTPRAT
jgi:hypothetical protein